MVSVRATVLSVTALAAYIQHCPAPFAAIPAAVSVGLTTARVAVAAISVARGVVKLENDIENGENERRDFHDLHVVRTFNRVDYLAARQDPNQRAWQLCREQLGNATVTFSGPAQGEVLAQGLPPACMTLSGVVTGKYNEGNPVPQGVDSVLFTGLSDETIDEIQDALSQKQRKL